MTVDIAAIRNSESVSRQGLLGRFVSAPDLLALCDRVEQLEADNRRLRDAGQQLAEAIWYGYDPKPALAAWRDATNTTTGAEQ